MMIKEIKIDKYYWKLHPKVNILGGPNGSGKTWLLEKVYYNFLYNKNIIFIANDSMDYENDLDKDAFKLIPFKNSSGLKRLSLLFKAAKQRPEILLIDDAELHLHVDIQRILLKTLLSFSPKTQFIVTTHGPAIISGWYDNVKEISQILIDSENNGK